MDLEARLRNEVQDLLAGGKVDVVIGYGKGSLPFTATPCFLAPGDDPARLVWNAFCSANLAVYLPRFRGKRVGIVAKGCDTRVLVELLKERQIRREDLVILGMVCPGMEDPDPASRGLSHEERLYPDCRTCTSRNPMILDVRVGTPLDEGKDAYADVDAFAARPSEERWEHVKAEMDRCIRCNACRNACPLCYCETCFADDPQPPWIGRGSGTTDTLVFHLLRSLHLAGRCVDCGACRRACPLNVDIRTLQRKVNADVARLFQGRAGFDAHEPQPLSVHRGDDPEAFLLSLSPEDGS